MNTIPSCPYCASKAATLITREGVQGNLCVYRCETCRKEWHEVVSPPAEPVEKT